MTDELIKIGTIVAPHGLKGEVKVRTNSDFPERFKNPGKRWLKRPHEEELELVTLKKGYYVPGKNLYIVKLKEITDRNQAEALRKSQLFAQKRDRPYLENNEHHVSDLVNLTVIDQQTGTTIGQVLDIYRAGNDLLMVELEPSFIEQHLADYQSPKTQVFIPFVQDLVPVVDIDKGEIEVTLPPGLLTLNN